MIVPISFPYPHSLQADEFEHSGNKWNPQLHFTGSLEDPVEIRFIESLLRKYGRNVVAHFIYSPYFGTYSVELQFNTDANGTKAKIACLTEYHSAFTSTGKLKKSVAKEFSFDSGQFRLISVRPALEPEIIAIDVSEFRTVVEATVGNRWELLSYPHHLSLPVTVICAESGIHYASAYNRWGLVGDFVITRFSKDGRSLSLAEKHIEQALEHLKKVDDGYLNPNCGVLNVFQEPFDIHGIPPSGWVPTAGRWFE